MHLAMPASANAVSSSVDGVGGGGGGGLNYNNNNSSVNNSNDVAKQTSATITTLSRLSGTCNNISASQHHNHRNLARPKPVAGLSLTHFVNSTNTHHLSGNIRSSVTSAFSSPSSSYLSRTNRGSVMETPAPYPSTISSMATTSTSTPRPGSRQSVASVASPSSVSPPGSSGNIQLISTAVDQVAVVPVSSSSGNEVMPTTASQECAIIVDPALDLPTFDKSDDMTDIVLEVEGHKLHAHRVMLLLVSPVFRAMLTSDFIERKQSVITLKDKQHDEVLEFLQSIYPPWKSVSGANVRVLLKFADEYRVDGLLRRCEDFLLALKMARDTHEQRLWAYDQGQPFCRVSELLGLANSFNLERLSRALVDYLSPRPLAWQVDGPDFFAYSGPELENRILNKALTTALTLIDRNRYCDTVKELLHGHKVYFE